MEQPQRIEISGNVHFLPTFSCGTLLLYPDLDPRNDIVESLYSAILWKNLISHSLNSE
jgi:hypothetical protein